jgi:murein L,D-transpeptidase YcbB/YkuD
MTIASLRRDTVAAFLALMTVLAPHAFAQDADPAAAVEAFHATRAGSGVWVEDTSPPTLNRRGAAVAGVLANAGRQGLEAGDYTLGSADTPQALDRALTRALLNYLTDLQAGRIAPREADPDLFVFRREIDAPVLLARVERSDDPQKTLADLAPANPIYRRLRRLLLEYRAIATAGGWGVVSAGDALKPGMTDPRIAEVRARLAVTHDLTPNGALSEQYDPTLEQGVRQFQRRHGLDSDGVIGARTLAALNVPVGERIRQIILNMERFRWMPDDFGDDHVFVNMAGFELDYIVHGETRLSMRVIVGRPYRETPIFSDAIRYMEFNPTWTVPPRIAINDLLPKIRKDPSFLGAGGYEVFAGWQEGAARLDPAGIDWSTVGKGRFPYRLRQAPGDKNALGQVKFMFPNRFDVYLHDTPSRELFRKSVRNFSSGCIRLEKPLALAEAMLQADGQDPGRVRTVLASKKTTRISFATPVPVHLAYLTAWIGEGGTVEFRDDIYGRDALLAKALGL